GWARPSAFHSSPKPERPIGVCHFLPPTGRLLASLVPGSQPSAVHCDQMILRILALALLVLAGCSPLEPGSLRVDPDDALSSHVAEAASRIHAAIGVTIQVGSGKGAALRVPARLVPADTLQPSAGTLPKGCDSDAACEWSGHFDGKTILVNE